jgi:hypothetical protein
MSTNTSTANDEVAAPIVHFLHVDESGTDPVYTLLALFNKDDLSLSVDEGSEDYTPAAERRTRRTRTNNTIDLEAATPFAADLSAMELIGFADSNGKLTTDTEPRQLKPADNEFVEIAYQNDEGNDRSDAELIHRLEDVEFVSPEIDMSATPPIVSFTAWIEGSVYFNYTG